MWIGGMGAEAGNGSGLDEENGVVADGAWELGRAAGRGRPTRTEESEGACGERFGARAQDAAASACRLPVTRTPQT